MGNGTLVRNAPDCSAAIFADKERAVLRDGKSRGAPPDLFIREDETNHEILVFPSWLAVLVERKTHNFVAGADGSVPGTMKRDERVTVVFGREIPALIEHDLERSRVGLEEHIGYGDTVFQVGVLAFVARIFVVANVEPWPAVKGSLLDMRRVIEGRVVSKAVSFIDHSPKLSRTRLKSNP